MSDLPEPPQYSFKLLSVAPRQGWAWVRQGFAAFMRRPLPYAMLLLMFLFAGLVSLTLPVVGGVLLLFVLPLLSLGYMIATRSGGHYATLYTHIDDFVESVRAVTPTGVMESVRLGLRENT